MGMYSNLLLSTGGGIISAAQQAKQAENISTLLIGLGGTGIDCLMEVKKMVRECLQPDKTDGSMASHQSIQFLAIDCDSYNLESVEVLFDKTEIFDILDSCMMGIKSKALYEKIMNSIRLALSGGERDAHLYVHIFSGLSGRVGGGIFQDVCYLTRKAIDETVAMGGIISGYFFLPRVNLSKMKLPLMLRDQILKNGYAAMQKLDYLMSIPKSKEQFTQIYQSGISIKSSAPVVDLCYLYDSPDIKDPKSYDRILHNVAEYILTLLTKPAELDQSLLRYGKYDDDKFYSGRRNFIEGDICQRWHIWRTIEDYTLGNKASEYNCYWSSGIVSARIPVRKINTYLTGKVFEVFADLQKCAPTQDNIKHMAECAGISWNMLLNELGRDGIDDPLAVIPEDLDWEFIRDNGDQYLENYYMNHKVQMEQLIECNAKRMVSESEINSIISRICRALDECIKDLKRGPFYACKMIDLSYQGNLRSIIYDMLLVVRTELDKKHYEVYEKVDCAKHLYEESRRLWYSEKNRKLKIKVRKAYDCYVTEWGKYVQGQTEIMHLEKLEWVLQEINKKISVKADEYYSKFSSVIADLIETFQENQRFLADNREENELFSLPKTTVDKIQRELTTEIKKMDMPEIWKAFVNDMFSKWENDQPVWCSADENKISKVVNDFFSKKVCRKFIDRSLSEYLCDNRETHPITEASEFICRAYLSPMVTCMRETFPCNEVLYEDNVSGNDVVYVPGYMTDIENAFEMLPKTKGELSMRRSSARDRISCARYFATVLPLSDYEKMIMDKK